jgi:nitroimidazol reductase NimA-like FMN-containing flavoprotein (pyridoxamine 5'-phosphate oxidase superfamily)
MHHEETNPVQVLGRRDCWALVGAAEVGRLALVIGGELEIFPVNHVVHHGAVIFRTAPGTKLAGIHGETKVVFEVDGFDAATGVAWSVVAKGHAERVTARQEIAEAEALPLRPWHGGPKHWFVRIRPGELTGRRFQVAG